MLVCVDEITLKVYIRNSHHPEMIQMTVIVDLRAKSLLNFLTKFVLLMPLFYLYFWDSQCSVFPDS